MPSYELDQGKMTKKDREIILCFDLISPEAKKKIDREISLLIDTKIRDILEQDPMYCQSRGWDVKTQTA